MMTRIKILIVDDDEKIIYAFRKVLEKDGHICLEAENGKQALEMLSVENPDMMFMDINMPEMNGINALQEIKSINPGIPVVIITGEGTMNTAIEAMRFGAFQYLQKPLSVQLIRDEVSKAIISLKTVRSELDQIELDAAYRHQLVGNSSSMHEIYKLIGSICISPNHTTVLITGETGTGKELVARAIHNNGANGDQPFVAVNCTALPDTLLESELFGHERGAFTGALNTKIGRFEYANNGTIFLDEIGDLSPLMQNKLLRVLQEREMQRLGGHDSIPVEARFIAATNQKLDQLIAEGEFREDLYYRLNIVNIHIPPLREHKEDIFLLANFFLCRYNQNLKKCVSSINDEALELLRAYDYPGNIRELENLIERAVMLTQSNVLLPGVFKKLSQQYLTDTGIIPLASKNFSEAREYVLEKFEKKFIKEKLDAHKGNVSAAARSAGMTRQNFHRLMAKYIRSNEE
jgi:two-component system, NtrC family, response regulator AtoC